MSAESVRAEVWSGICERYTDPALRLSAWQQAEVNGQVPDDEWIDAHAGTCSICRTATARLYPGGWFCTTHRPSTPSPREMQ